MKLRNIGNRKSFPLMRVGLNFKWHRKLRFSPTRTKGIVTLVALGLFVAWLIGTNDLVAQNEHEGHEHAEKTDDHAEKEGEDEEHDEHGYEEKVVKLSDADMKKFGIEVATAGTGKLPVDISLPGEVAVNEDRIAHVTPRVPGVVREVRKTLGDRVRVG